MKMWAVGCCVLCNIEFYDVEQAGPQFWCDYNGETREHQAEARETLKSRKKLKNYKNFYFEIKKEEEGMLKIQPFFIMFIIFFYTTSQSRVATDGLLVSPNKSI